ncbi:MAG: zinc ribbon domain-containing protein [Propionibacteriaceae bacterium]|jgi:putative FmdB family regulatory protein|nr:zinc ribbon domain-containing protein [Propionibacteriaceae bacterium]
MPTYQYRCTECGTELEAVQKFTDDPLTVCPECDGRLRKVFNAVGVVFKGSGFYATDNRARKHGEAKPKPESAAAPAKTESKPASASPSSSSTTKTPAA